MGRECGTDRRHGQAVSPGGGEEVAQKEVARLLCAQQVQQAKGAKVLPGQRQTEKLLRDQEEQEAHALSKAALLEKVRTGSESIQSKQIIDYS